MRSLDLGREATIKSEKSREGQALSEEVEPGVSFPAGLRMETA